MNEIVKSQNVIQSMDDVERAARAMAASKFFPDSREAAQAIVKVLAGRELGFGAFASMTGVAIIQGKPVVGANLTAAAIKQTGKYNYRVTEHTEQVCRIKFFENGQEVGVSSFTMEDARAAGLVGKDNWKKYPRNMLFARAISNGQKWYAPDVYNGVTVYTPDEMGAVVDEEGNAVIEAVTVDERIKPTPQSESKKPQAQPAPTDEHKRLVQEFAESFNSIPLPLRGKAITPKMNDEEALKKAIQHNKNLAVKSGDIASAEMAGDGLDPTDGLPFGDK
jgi:hypothetical protein